MTDTPDPAALLARKKRTCSGHRASTTRLVDRATTTMEAREVDTEQLSLIKQMLIEKAETLKVLDSEMAELVPDEELEEEIQRVDEYKERIYGVLTKLTKALEHTVTPPPHGRSES